MSQKFFISLVSVLGAAAFLAAPVAAQAASSPVVFSIECKVAGECNKQLAGTEKFALGPQKGGTELVIKGEHFLEGGKATGVFFLNGAATVEFKVATESPTEITGSTKESPGLAAGQDPILVFNTGVTCAAPKPPFETCTENSNEGQIAVAKDPSFTYGPLVTSISPTSGSTAGGTLVTIKGQGFGATGAAVKIGTAATIKAGSFKVTGGVDEVEATTTTGNKSGPSEVVVSNTANGTSNSAIYFNYTNPAALPPHYYVNGLGEGARAPEGAKILSISWGTLSFTNTKGGSGGTFTCHNIISASSENPVGSGENTGAKGPAGVGVTEGFSPYDCEGSVCTSAATGGGPATYISVESKVSAFEPSEFESFHPFTNLGWKSSLLSEESTKLIRSETIGIVLNVQCHIETAATGTGEPIFGVVTQEISEGNLRPSSGPPRTNAAVPPELEFDTKGAKSGELHGPAPSESGRTGKTEGSLKAIGYLEQQTVNTKLG